MAGYQLKITMKGSKPPIWRRVIIPDKITFEQLHETIQDAFCWMDCHLHEFILPSENLRVVDDIEEAECWDDKRVIEENARIDEYIHEGQKFQYTYDFGDDWEHVILVEKKLDDYKERYPQVVKYKGDVIPEDCGGIWGYYDLLESLETGAPHDSGLDEDELSEWAYEQGMQEYDMAEVNEVLKENCTFSPAKKRKVKENQYDEEVSVRAMPRDYEEQFQKIKKLLEKANGVPEWHAPSGIESILQIYESYSKEDLIEIAKLNGMKGYRKLSKKDLASYLAEKMLLPAQMRRIFSYFDDDEIELFERLKEEGGVAQGMEAFSAEIFADTGYAGIEIMGDVMIPKDVFEAYERINTREFHNKRHRVNTACDYAKALTWLYGVVPGDIYLKVFNKYEENEMLWTEYISIFKEKLREEGEYMLADTSLVVGYLAEDEEFCEYVQKSQQDKPFYIPTKAEIEYIAENGYLTTDLPVQKLFEFFVKTLKADEDTAGMVCWQTEQEIATGCDMEDLLEVAFEEGIMIKNKKQMQKFMKLLQDVWNNTRMMKNRGFTPIEARAGYAPDISIPETYDEPDHAEIDFFDMPYNMGKIIPFERNEKKIYPNDPCPCGSGKKYKHCCGKK